MTSAGAEPSGEADIEAVLAEQVAYYRARAPEYDQWWRRKGAWDLGPDFNASWQANIDQVVLALDGFGPTGDVVELAAGTGGLTVELAREPPASPPWTPPPRRLRSTGPSWPDLRWPWTTSWLTSSTVSPIGSTTSCSSRSGCPTCRPSAPGPSGLWSDRALAPAGRFFLIDNGAPSKDLLDGVPGINLAESVMSSPRSVTDLDARVAVRELADGRRFRVVKRYWAPNELEAELVRLGWVAHIERTDD